jgi:hypothetical protein
LCDFHPISIDWIYEYMGWFAIFIDLSLNTLIYSLQRNMVANLSLKLDYPWSCCKVELIIIIFGRVGLNTEWNPTLKELTKCRFGHDRGSKKYWTHLDVAPLAPLWSLRILLLLVIGSCLWSSSFLPPC